MLYMDEQHGGDDAIAPESAPCAPIKKAACPG
jgi:hypothetical protein